MSAQRLMAAWLLTPPLNAGRGTQCSKYLDYAYMKIYQINNSNFNQ